MTCRRCGGAMTRRWNGVWCLRAACEASPLYDRRLRIEAMIRYVRGRLKLPPDERRRVFIHFS